MELNSFRKLLAKKAKDVYLENFVKLAKEDVFANIVLESLEKMARPGETANLPIRDFGVEMDKNSEPKMIHDALSHHVSRYKTALNILKDNPDNSHYKDAANEHAGKVFRLMDAANKIAPHSEGKLSVKADAVTPWERNVKTERKDASSKAIASGSGKLGSFVTDTKGWRYSGHKGNKYEFLQQEPHEALIHKVASANKNTGYPLEKIQINGKHLNVENVDAEKVGESHFFDEHPILTHHSTIRKGKNSRDDHRELLGKQWESYSNGVDKWHDDNDHHIEAFHNRVNPKPVAAPNDDSPEEHHAAFKTYQEHLAHHDSLTKRPSDPVHVPTAKEPKGDKDA